MKRIGLVVKDQEDSIVLAKEIHSYLSKKGVRVTVDKESSEKAGFSEGCIIDKMEVDLFIVLGGDGTILKTVSKARDKSIPILGINFGTTGFLAQVEPEDWKDALNLIITGRYELDKRDKLGVRVKGVTGCALNEAVIITAVPVEILDLKLMVDGAVVQDIKADGLIISTPTGSTAYSKSCGGPIVDPRVKGFIVTPICPFEGNLKALVVPQEAKIEVKLEGKSNALVVIDGEEKLKFPTGSTAAFSLPEEKTFFVRKGDFYSKLRERR